jgi:hypothetical protein
MIIQKYEHGISMPEHFIEVERASWRIAGGVALATFRASSCFVIAVHDSESNAGYLGHFSLPAFDNEISPQSMFREVSHNQADITKLSAWVGGASLATGKPRHNAMILEHREYIFMQLARLVGAQQRVENTWLDVDEDLRVVVFEPQNYSVQFAVSSLK